MLYRNSKGTAAFLALALALTGCSQRSGSDSSPAPRRGADATSEADTGSAGGRRATGPKPYAQVITRTAQTDSGLFTVHRIGDKLFYEIPRSEMGEELLLVSRIAQTAADLGYGGEQYNRQVVRWVPQGDRILLRTVQYSVVADDTLPIAQAVRASNFEPILRSFPIAAYGPDSAAVIEVTELFTKDVPVLGLGQRVREQYKVRRMDESRAYIESARSFPRNIEVRHVLTYEATEPPTNSSTGTISVEMNQSMVKLPDNPMRPRYYDARVGFFGLRRINYGLDAQRAEEQRFISRWRLEPSDTAAFLRGELVDPIKPIVYYVDPATPVKWRGCLKSGVEDWNEAFAAAGFKNAIIAKDPPTPEDDPEFSPEDARYSVIRYFASDIQNAYGPHVADPRTGEILESDIGWYHNVMNLVRNWFFVQTAAANPAARRVRFDDEVMCELIRFVSAHEVGHTIGLPHNMKASAAYPVDSLRSASFTQRNNTAASIMDYARFNYIAQPGDTGVNFLPGIGEYDKWAVRWGYRPIIEAPSPEAERPILNRWVKEKEGNPIYLFGDPAGTDPTSQTEALGDDPVKASEYGIANLQRILPRLPEWTFAEGEDFDDLEELYDAVLGQWARYMGHVTTVVGGVTQTRKTMDQRGRVFEPVPEAEQRRALQFLNRQAFQTPEWMIENDILLRLDNPNAVERLRARQTSVINNLLEPRRMLRIVEAEAVLGDAAYTLDEVLSDVRRGVWTELASGGEIDLYRRNLQRAYLARMQYLMEYQPPAVRPGGGGGFGPQAPPINLEQSDIPAFARGELVALQPAIRAAIARTSDRATRLHLQDALARIEEILDTDD